MQILTANRLSDGVVVYWAGGGAWHEEMSRAKIVSTAEDASAATRVGQADALVVGAYLMDVRQQDGTLAPVKMREVIRAAGPSVRLDLGKQAER